MRRLSSSSVVALAVVGGLLAFLFWQFHVPSLLFLNTTTAGGDTGSHVALPMYMEQHLLPHGRLTGWDPQWYDGFPAFSFYFPLPSLMVVVLHKILAVFLGTTEGYNIAFKVITALGSFALPVAAWGFGRLWGLRNPAATCLAVATLPFLFDRTFTIYGGNIASTLAGEYAFSISLALGLLFLGVMARGLRTGRHRSLAAVLLALTGLCHLLPTLFVLAGAVVLVLMHLSRRALRWSIPTLVVGGLLAGFWWVPFLLRVGYTTDMGWQRLTDFLKILFPGGDQWVAVMAAAGAVLAVVGLRLARRRWADDLGIFLILMTLVSAAAVRFVPQAKIWNARFLPFWEFCLYLLAGFAVAEGGALVGRLYSLSRLRRDGAGGGPSPAGVAGVGSGGGPSPAGVAGVGRWATPLVVPVLAGLVAVVLVGGPLGAFDRVARDVGVSSLGADLGGGPANASFIPDWIRWNYTGYQQKAAYPEYRALIDTMAGLGRKYGCGRAMWEYESEQNRFGTPEALMLLPYWTNDCIDSMEGLLFESASSTPYHFIDQAELSEAPSDAMLGLPYGPVNVTEGIAHLQMLGVKYYMTFSPQIQSQASANPALKLVATSGPWPDQYTTGNQTTTKQITWDIYEIQGSDMVAPLQFEPAVLTSKVNSAKAWLNMSVAWYDSSAAWPVPLAATGPPSWPRVPLGDTAPPHVAVPPVTATNIVSRDDRISFDVSRIGSPVVVRASYYPNWQATGALGPYRITPNLMVVVPTALHVSLHYGWTPVDGLALAATVAGLAGLVLMRHPLPWPEPEPPVLIGPGPAAEGDDLEDEDDHFATGISHSVWDGWPFRAEPETAEGGLVEPAGEGTAPSAGQGTAEPAGQGTAESVRPPDGG